MAGSARLFLSPRRARARRFEPGLRTRQDHRALVGVSGAGKSTIVALLLRFYKPQAGAIFIDAQDIAGVELRSCARTSPMYRRMSSCSAARSATTSRSAASARRSRNRTRGGPRQCRRFHPRLPQRLRHGCRRTRAEPVGRPEAAHRHRPRHAEGCADPRARRADRRARFESEREVRKALDELRSGRTTIVIAHRLETILSADAICVIDRGRLVARGAHAEQLFAREPAYRALVEAQFGEDASAKAAGE
ncbi:MAG: ATP-binding cassette domain-containing protein [Rhodoblastus sp.]